MKPICPICMGPGVPARGPDNANVLLIGEFPGESEMKSYKPFSGPAGAIMRQEFANNGIDVGDFRLTNIWIHPPNETDKDEDCLKYSMGLLKDEAKKKRAILLIGSDVVSTLTDHKVSDVTGLQIETKFFPKVEFIMATVNPAIVFHNTVGEIRFAIANFSKALKDMGLIYEEEW